MATAEINIIRVQTTFTFDEAIEHMKMMDKQHPFSAPIKWINVKTGKPVSIGYTS